MKIKPIIYYYDLLLIKLLLTSYYSWIKFVCDANQLLKVEICVYTTRRTVARGTGQRCNRIPTVDWQHFRWSNPSDKWPSEAAIWIAPITVSTWDPVDLIIRPSNCPRNWGIHWQLWDSFAAKIVTILDRWEMSRALVSARLIHYINNNTINLLID